MRTGSRRYRGRSGDEGHGRARINHLDCFSAAIPPRVTCGPATCPRVEEHLGKPCRQAQVRDEEFIIDTGKLCPAGRTYRKDLTAASSPGSGKLCPGFTASQGLAGPRRQTDRPSYCPAKKSLPTPFRRVGGCYVTSGDSGIPGGIARFADAAAYAPDGWPANCRLTAGGESRHERVNY